MRIARKRPALVLALFALALGCAGTAPYRRGAPGVLPLRVRSVEWNPTRAKLAGVRAVADAGDVTAVFAEDAVTVLRAGAIVGAPACTGGWMSAESIPAADGNGSWLVGVDAGGQLRRIRSSARIESVAERYGLGGQRVVDVRALGAGLAAFRLEDAVAIADATTATRLFTGPVEAIAGGGGQLALLGEGEVRVIDARTRAGRSFAVRGARAIALDERGRLHVATSRAVYAEDPARGLQLRYVAGAELRGGLAAGGGRVWFNDGGDLGFVEDQRVAVTAGQPVAASARLEASPSGEVWVIEADSLQRFAPDEDGGGTAFQRTIGPVFARACSACHLPGGRSGVDLSTANAWESARATIRERVIEQRSMPPLGHTLAEEDRAAVRAWLELR